MDKNKINIDNTNLFIKNIFSKIGSLHEERLRHGFIKQKTRIYKDEKGAKIGEIADKIEKREYKKGDKEKIGVNGNDVISELLKRQIEDKFEEI